LELPDEIKIEALMWYQPEELMLVKETPPLYNPEEKILANLLLNLDKLNLWEKK
jgi:hypothetical protein